GRRPSRCQVSLGSGGAERPRHHSVVRPQKRLLFATAGYVMDGNHSALHGEPASRAVGLTRWARSTRVPRQRAYTHGEERPQHGPICVPELPLAYPSETASLAGRAKASLRPGGGA